MQFTPHEPNTGSPASSAAKTSGVLGAPLFGLLALAAVGIAGGGVGAGLGSLPGIPGLEGAGVKHAGPRIARGAPTEQARHERGIHGVRAHKRLVAARSWLRLGAAPGDGRRRPDHERWLAADAQHRSA